jgi:hypothetical protein
MRGQPEFGHPAFKAAAAWWRAHGPGYEVVNPAEFFGGVTTHPRERYMREALRALLECEAICMLPGWEGSDGARLEHEAALQMGLRVFLELPREGGDAQAVEPRPDTESEDGAPPPLPTDIPDQATCKRCTKPRWRHADPYATQDGIVHEWEPR